MSEKKRIAIFSFYNINQKLTKDVEYLINDLKQVVYKMVIVVNGQLEEYEKISSLADYLIIRKNKGYDAGAYKTALFNDTVYKMIEECDELIFCNDTFYGPFIPFEKIIERMDSKKTDFWGLNLSNNGLITFIQSYFMLFKKQIWESGNLKFFFETTIDSDTLDYHSILINFERGIFDFLVSKGYSFGTLNLQKYHVYTGVDGSICYEGLPILKKKAFSDQFFIKEKLLNALHYIEENYNYDIKLILEDIKERYSLILDYDEIIKHKIQILSKKMPVTKVTRKMICQFAATYEKIYIYGVGIYGKMVKDCLMENHIKGFIVSNDQKENSFFENIPIYEISEFTEKKEIPIIVALNEKNKKQIENLLCGFENVMYIF